MNNQTSGVSNIYKLNGRVPILKAIPFGLQHILAMFVSNLAPITIVAAAAGLSQDEIAVLLQNAMVVSGLDREITDKEISGSLACDGYASAISSLILSFVLPQNMEVDKISE